MTVFHTIPPVFNADSKVLILGSFPSVKSREAAFYYGHPQNRFWRVLSGVLSAPLPTSTEEKKAMLLRHHIALWDVIAACEINGSADSSIKNAQPNDLSLIFSAADIRAVFTNGKTADRLFDRYFQKSVSLPKVCLPSTSPANARYSFDDLAAEWNAINTYIR